MKSKWDQTQKPKEQKWFYEIPKYFRHSTRNIIQVLFPTRWKANTARAEIVFKFDFKQNSGWTLLLRFKFKCNITQRSSLPNMCWYKTTRFKNHKIIANNILMFWWCQHRRFLDKECSIAKTNYCENLLMYFCKI